VRKGSKRSKADKKRISIATRKAMRRPEVYKKLGSGVRGKPAWNKGLTEKTSKSVALNASKMRKTLRDGPTRKAWNKGLSCPRDKDSSKRSGQTFRRRYAEGLIKTSPVKWPGIRYTRKDGSKVYLRSSYERTFAVMLDSVGMEWFYEPKRFLLSDGHVYTPDFLIFIPEELKWLFGRAMEFVEVKGWFRDSDRKKLELFRKDYPQVPFRFVDNNSMLLLQILERHFEGKKLEPRHRTRLEEFEMAMKRGKGK